MLGPTVPSLAALVDTLRPRGPADLGDIPTSAAEVQAGSAFARLRVLDELAAERRDWHPTVEAALGALSRDDSLWAREAVADFFWQAAMAPRFLTVAERLVAQDPDVGAVEHPQRVTPARRMADQLPALRTRAEAFAVRPPRILLKGVPWRFVSLDGRAALLEAAEHALEHGNPRQGEPERWRRPALGWLAELAAFVDPIAEEVPGVLEALTGRDDARSGAAALELAACVCCKPALAPWLDDLARRSPGWLDAPAAPQGLPPRIWLERARVAVAEERATPPPTAA